MTTKITEKAMLVSLSVCRFGNRKHEQGVSDEVATQYAAEAAMGRYNKRLLAKESVSAINAAAAAARTFHYEQSLPWLDNGFRILPATNYFAYTAEMKKLRDRFETAVDEFISDFDKYKEDAKFRLGRLYKEADYPTVAQLRSRFSLEVSFAPLPDAIDFRVALNDEELDKIRAQITQRTDEAIKNAMADLWKRLHDAVVGVRDRLDAYDVDEQGRIHNPFRGAMFEHLRHLCELMKRLNLTGDAGLEATRKKLEETLAGLDVEVMREEPFLRHKAIADANAILAQMAGYVGDGVALPEAA